MKKTRFNRIFFRQLVRVLQGTRISRLAILEVGVEIGSGSQIWEFSKVRAGAVIGKNVNVGMQVYVGPGVKIGNNCKIQNNASLYEPLRIGDGVFVGPGVIFTNDKYPRATDESGKKLADAQWNKVGVLVENSASIGAGAICVAPVIIGSTAMIAAGAVVTKNVPSGARWAGVPATDLP